ncbi:MAG: hypothetical protein ACYDEV_14960 [Acidiferrobacter sp.]
MTTERPIADITPSPTYQTARKAPLFRAGMNSAAAVGVQSLMRVLG